MTLWTYTIVILAYAVPAALAILCLCLWAIIWLERHAGCPEPDPHEEAHGDVVKPPPAAWRGP